MSCFLCKSTLENGFTTFMSDLGSCIVIIKNVPAFICSQCGEVAYSDEVSKKIEKIVNDLKNHITDIAVTDYRTVA